MRVAIVHHTWHYLHTPTMDSFIDLDDGSREAVDLGPDWIADPVYREDDPDNLADCGVETLHFHRQGGHQVLCGVVEVEEWADDQ